MADFLDIEFLRMIRKGICVMLDPSVAGEVRLVKRPSTCQPDR